MQINKAFDILAGQYTFLNKTQIIDFPPDWSNKNVPKLWQYNVHYFEWLWALEYDDAKLVTLDWINHHTLSKGQAGWESYPISLRLMNICGVFFGRFQEQVETDRSFLDPLWQSIYRQCQWLMSHLEVHLLGNHYFENAAALIFLGSCFKGDAAQEWLNRGITILEREIPEQVQADGMHFELSPMYHSRMLYLHAILLATNNEQIVRLIKPTMNRMRRALDNLCHPDGQIALLSDSAFGIYNSPRQIEEYCTQICGERAEAEPMGDFSLADAGYYGWHGGKGNYIICDFGKIGPDYIPGHAHADIFNYELSLRGYRVIVDSGVCDYEVSETRRYCRSTAAHNTVEIEAQDQCEMWGSFRVARRGYPFAVDWRPSDSGFEVTGSHNGYARLSGKPIHTRKITWQRQGRLSVHDEVRSSKPVNVVSRIHLHPSCSIDKCEATQIHVRYPAGCFRIAKCNQSRLSVVSGAYYPEFGVKQESTVIELSTHGEHVFMHYTVEDVE